MCVTVQKSGERGPWSILVLESRGTGEAFILTPLLQPLPSGRLIDILRCRGKRGFEAFLEALEFYYPEHFTLLTGQEPAQRCSMILGEQSQWVPQPHFQVRGFFILAISGPTPTISVGQIEKLRQRLQKFTQGSHRRQRVGWIQSSESMCLARLFLSKHLPEWYDLHTQLRVSCINICQSVRWLSGQGRKPVSLAT